MKQLLKRKYNHIIAISLACVLGGLFLYAPKAEAFSLFSIGGVASGVIDWAISESLYIIMQIAGLALALAGQMFDWALNITHFTSMPAVQTGWSISRDLVNMVLILVALVIAFATILHIESYGMKKLLPNLIIVALLINFSMPIAGIVIDFSQVLSQYFVNVASPDGNFSLNVAQGLSLQSTLQSTSGITSAASAAALPANFIISLGGGIVIISGAALAFSLGAFILIIRVMAIWILLMIMPIALFFMILPATSAIWTKWLHTFLRWVLFAPVYSFFMYLALFIVQTGALTKHIESSSSDLVTKGMSMPNFLNAYLKFDTILLYIVVIGLMFGGLIAANSMGLYGASGAMDVAKWSGRSARGYAGRWAARGGRIPLSKIPGVGKYFAGGSQRISRGLDKIGEKGPGWQKAANIAKGIPEAKRGLVASMHPTNIKAMWADNMRRAKRQSFDQGPGRDALETMVNPKAWGDAKQRTHYAEEARSKEVERLSDEYMKTIPDDALPARYAAEKGTNEKEAMLRVAARRGHLGKLYKGRGWESKDVDKDGKPIIKQEYNLDALQAHLNEDFASLGEDRIAKLGADLKGVSIIKGDINMAALTHFDGKKNNAVLTTEAADRRTAIVDYVRDEPAENIMKRLSVEAIYELDSKGNPSKVHSEGEVFLQTISANHVGNVKELKENTLKALSGGRAAALAAVADDATQTQIVTDLLNAVDKKLTGVEIDPKKTVVLK